MTVQIAGRKFSITVEDVRRSIARLDPEPIHEHFALIDGRRYPPKQVVAAVTGLDRADFTTHQARAILRRLGIAVHRRASTPHLVESAEPREGPHGGREAAALAPYRGRWVAQLGLEVLYDADNPRVVLEWLRRHNRRARVWRIPGQATDAGGLVSAP